MIDASSSSTNYKSILQHIFNTTNFTIFITLFLEMIVQQIEWDSFTIHFAHLITTLFNKLFITLHPSFSSSIQFHHNNFITTLSQNFHHNPFTKLSSQPFHKIFITTYESQFMNNTFTTILSQTSSQDLFQQTLNTSSS